MKKRYLLSIILIIILSSCSKNYSEQSTAFEDYFEQCTVLDGDEKEVCMFKVINETQDYLLCNYFENVDTRDGCYWHGAILKGNEKLCDDIADVDIKTNCLISVLKDIAICEGLNESRKESCLLTIAIDLGDISICERLGGYNRESCFITIAHDMKDFTVCNNIQSEKYKWFSCYGELLDKSGNIDFCNNLENNRDRFSCSTFFSVRYDNFSVCKENPELKIECFAVMGYISGFVFDTCNKLIDKERDDCYLKETEYGVNGVCKEIADSNKKNDCLKIEECEIVEDKDTCYLFAAKELNHKEICYKIKEADIKSSCLSRFN